MVGQFVFCNFFFFFCAKQERVIYILVYSFTHILTKPVKANGKLK